MTSMNLENLKLQSVEVWERINVKLSRVNPTLLVVGSIAGTVIFIRIRRLLRRSEKPLHKRFIGYVFSLICSLPFARRRVEHELSIVHDHLLHSVHECDAQLDFFRRLPDSPGETKKLLAHAADYAEMNRRFSVNNGRVSGTVYTDLTDNAQLELLTEVFKMYAFSNPLHPDVFPGCRKMEAEVVRMVADLFHGDQNACGTMTTGGTESIILACYAYRNRALSRGITEPVIVAPVTAHAAFQKAADLMGIRIRHVAVDAATQTVNVVAMRRAICRETCMLVGSVPNFPSGSVDNIPAIAELGVRYGIPVHVDACLGGFIVAFAEDIGLPIPVFDFRLRGVTSISCDTHKYGYAPKGTSTVVYRSADFLHRQYFSVTDWPGGIYATPTISGSRAGLNIALTWATLLHFGRDGYVNRARAIIDTARRLADACATVPGVELCGRADVSVVALHSRRFNIYAVADEMKRLGGWNLNVLQEPAAIHFCLTYNQTRHADGDFVDSFVRDLRAACERVDASERKGNDSDTAGLYGMATQIPDKTLIDEITALYLDSCYSMPVKTRKNGG